VRPAVELLLPLAGIDVQGRGGGFQVEGRIVGASTHMPALKEEFDQRFLVEKVAVASRVRVEVI
jgi:hypothetical protein